MDNGYQGIWVWVGKRANEKERVEALRNARGFVKKKRYPNNTKVTRVVEVYEPLEFKALFNVWKDKEDNKAGGKIQTGIFCVGLLCKALISITFHPSNYDILQFRFFWRSICTKIHLHIIE